jgi:hypothetical protein
MPVPDLVSSQPFPSTRDIRHLFVLFRIVSAACEFAIIPGERYSSAAAAPTYHGRFQGIGGLDMAAQILVPLIIV